MKINLFTPTQCKNEGCQRITQMKHGRCPKCHANYHAYQMRNKKKIGFDLPTKRETERLKTNKTCSISWIFRGSR